MVEAITATYAQEDDDWAITVAGLGKRLTARAPGIIAARDRVDQLVEGLVADTRTRTTVVHLLGGSALDFTSTYISARLARTDPPAEQTDADPPTTEASAADDPAKPEKPSPLAASKQLPSEVPTAGQPATPAQRTGSTPGGVAPLAEETTPPART